MYKRGFSKNDFERPERGSRPRHPPHLKGREIGLYYARLNQKKTERNEIQQRSIVALDEGKEKKILGLLEKAENDEAKPGTSFHSSSFASNCQNNVEQGDYEENDLENPERWGTTRPPHLKGKDIGYFHAGIKQKKRVRNAIQQRSIVALDTGKEKHILGLLEKAQDDEQSPSTSFRSSSFATQYQSHLQQSILKEKSDCEYKPVTQGLCRNSKLDEEFYRELLAKEGHPRVQSFLEFRKKLPIFQKQEEILYLIEKNQIVVLSGETGCGKTTQVTQFILDSYVKSNRGSLCKIVCTQPRRISTITVAERVAEERGEVCNVNGSVGWQIRLENKLPREYGSILYCTTGTLIQQLRGDRYITGVSHVILDEIHERDLDTDFLLIILKDLLVKRPDLKLILMSATLNAESFAVYFGNCPMIHIPGFTYPVREYYLEDVLELTRYSSSSETFKRKRKWHSFDQELEAYLLSLDERGRYSQRTMECLRNWDEDVFDPDVIFELLVHICQFEGEGAVLVFLPSWDQISTLHRRITSEYPFNTSQFLILPLHSMMPTVNQREIFQRPKPGVRKIIIATNIAETSITVDDVVYVIDSGKIKISNFDENKNIATLQPEWVALANAHQRRGRAGRVQPGICYHLFTKYRESKLAQYQLPEILRTRLENIILKIKILNLGKAEIFLQKALNPPSPKVVELSLDLLRTLNALDANEYLTPLGFHLARLPMDPLTGRMILFGAMFSCLDPILSVAASLSFKDAFVVPLGKEKLVDKEKRKLAFGSRSDHLMLANATLEWENAEKYGRGNDYCWNHFLSSNTLKMLVKMKKQFAGYLEDLKFLHCSDPKHCDFNRNSSNTKLLKAIVCAGLYPNVARLRRTNIGRGGPTLFTKEHHGKLHIHPKSVNSEEKNFESEWLVYYQKVKSVKLYLHDTTEVDPYALLFFGGKITTEMDRGFETAVVDEWIRFHCAEKTAEFVKILRAKLDRVLEQKINNPGVLSVDPNTQEGAVLYSIVELITSENLGHSSTDLIQEKISEF